MLPGADETRTKDHAGFQSLILLSTVTPSRALQYPVSVAFKALLSDVTVSATAEHDPREAISGPSQVFGPSRPDPTEAVACNCARSILLNGRS